MKLPLTTVLAALLACSCSIAPTRMETSSTSRLVPESFEPLALEPTEGVPEGAPLSEAELEAEAAELSSLREANYVAAASAAQEAQGQAEEERETGAGPSAEERAQANNPLADFTAFNLQNYHVSELTDIPNQTANTLWARYVVPIDKWLIRASLPINSVPTSPTTSESGFGDLNAFAAYIMSDDGAPQTYGVGPLLAIPTASDDALGTGKWQAGAAAVYFDMSSPEFQYGALATWQTDFAGDSSRDDTNLFVFQYFGFFQMGGGNYLRTAPIMTFNWVNGDYNIPIGLGFGKVFKLKGGNVLNVFIEPQFSIAHDGAGQPEAQLFFGVNTQFM